MPVKDKSVVGNARPLFKVAVFRADWTGPRPEPRWRFRGRWYYHLFCWPCPLFYLPVILWLRCASVYPLSDLMPCHFSIEPLICSSHS